MVMNDYTVCMTDPFATFDLPRRFDIDVESLSHRFIALCAEHHPDRFTDPIDQVEASERTARINESHRVLTDPEQRANILLQLLGGAAKGDDKSLPPDLLVDMMDVRQQQEEAQANDDTQTLRKLADWASSQHGAYLSKIALLFDAHDGADAPGRDEILADIRVNLNALRYMQRMIEQLPTL